MSEPKNKAEVLAAMRSAHAEMEDLLASLTPDQRTAPVLDDGWSVKDTLAHISAWEKMMIGWLEASLRGEHVVRFTPEFVRGDDPVEGERVMNQLNAHLFEQNKGRDWDDVLAEFRAAHHASLALVERMTEADLFQPDRFAWRKGSPAIDLIAGDTYEHYVEHSGWIRARFKLSGAA